MMAGDIEEFHVKISSTGGGYKSIKNLEWRNIPEFSILTGRNGSGKTQLLEILAYHLTGTRPPPPTVYDLTIEIGGAKYDADEVAHVPSKGRFSGSGSASVAILQSIRQTVFQGMQSGPHDPAGAAMARRLRRFDAAGTSQDSTSGNGNSSRDDKFSYLLVDVNVTAHLAVIFFDYRLRDLEALERGTPGIDKQGKPLGPAPWDVINESLQVAGFPYRVVSPRTVKIDERYDLKMEDISSGNNISPIDLSSGEQVLLQLVLWLFTSSKEGSFPKFLLLDEPDAPLHPSMTVQFLDVILEVLVRRHGIRVIMTTHSPSTVALAPDNAVFELERGSCEVRQVADKASVISTLTAGLITVSRTTRFCFVEDEDDVTFYNAVLEILVDSGPSKDPKAIHETPSLVFIAASAGRGHDKIAGGKTVVRNWIEKLDAAPLTSTFLGVIDLDNGNQPSTRIKVIGRYSFENYLLDPLNVFALLVGNGTAPAVSGVTITQGDEHLLRTLNNMELQAISDAITSKVEEGNPSLCKGCRLHVQYTRGMTINVPRWVIHHRGKSLLPLYQSAWGNAGSINQTRLTQTLRRVRLIPTELAALYLSIQTHA